jgi:hypothetical protein
MFSAVALGLPLKRKFDQTVNKLRIHQSAGLP